MDTGMGCIHNEAVTSHFHQKLENLRGIKVLCDVSERRELFWPSGKRSGGHQTAENLMCAHTGTRSDGIYGCC